MTVNHCKRLEPGRPIRSGNLYIAWLTGECARCPPVASTHTFPTYSPLEGVPRCVLAGLTASGRRRIACVNRVRPVVSNVGHRLLNSGSGLGNALFSTCLGCPRGFTRPGPRQDGLAVA